MVVTDRVRDVYERHVRALSATEQLQLVTLIAEGLESQASAPTEEPLHDAMEFYGVARGSRDGPDAQEYVNQLRGKGSDCQ